MNECVECASQRVTGLQALAERGNVVVEIDAEGAAAAVAAMDGAGAAALRAAAAQARAQAELVEDAGDWQLPFEVGEVDWASPVRPGSGG